MRIRNDAAKKFFLRLCAVLCACLLCAGLAGPVPVRAAEPAATPVLVQVYYVTYLGSILAEAKVMLTASGAVKADPDVVPDGYELTGETVCHVQLENGKARPDPVWFMIRKKGALSSAPAGTPPERQEVRVGNYVTFGHYPQTADGTDHSPIEWLVLDIQGSKALLLSRYGLDVKPYHKEETDITWQKCSLRSWLNGEFLQAAFSGEEQKAILNSNVDNGPGQGCSEYDTRGGLSTRDKVFLLSYAEAKKYVGIADYGMKSGSTNAIVIPTAYAISNEAYIFSTYETPEGSAPGDWWLRSPGGDQDCALVVTIDGSCSYDSVCRYWYDYDIKNNRLERIKKDDNKTVVRPALWISLDSGIF